MFNSTHAPHQRLWRKRPWLNCVVAIALFVVATQASAQQAAPREGADSIDTKRVASEMARPPVQSTDDPLNGSTTDPQIDANAGEASVSEQKQSATPDTLALETRAEWLALRFDAAADLSAFALERISDPGVRQFAEQDIEPLRTAARELRQLATTTGASATANDDVDLSDTVGEIGAVVRDRLRQRANQPAAADQGDSTPRRRDRRSTEDSPNRRSRNRNAESPARLQDPGPAAESALDHSTVAPSSGEADRRRPRGERARVLLPALRENLPEAMELVGEAIEDEKGVQGTAAWMEFERTVTNRLLEARKRELAGFHGAQLDQAYLGMALLANLELEAAAEVVMQEEADESRPFFQQITEQLRQRVQEGHRLMAEPQLTSDNAALRRSASKSVQQDAAGDATSPSDHE